MNFYYNNYCTLSTSKKLTPKKIFRISAVYNKIFLATKEDVAYYPFEKCLTDIWSYGRFYASWRFSKYSKLSYKYLPCDKIKNVPIDSGTSYQNYWYQLAIMPNCVELLLNELFAELLSKDNTYLRSKEDYESRSMNQENVNSSFRDSLDYFVFLEIYKKIEAFCKNETITKSFDGNNLSLLPYMRVYDIQGFIHSILNELDCHFEKSYSAIMREFLSVFHLHFLIKEDIYIQKHFSIVNNYLTKYEMLRLSSVTIKNRIKYTENYSWWRNRYIHPLLYYYPVFIKNFLFSCNNKKIFTDRDIPEEKKQDLYEKLLNDFEDFHRNSFRSKLTSEDPFDFYWRAADFINGLER